MDFHHEDEELFQDVDEDHDDDDDDDDDMMSDHEGHTGLHDEDSTLLRTLFSSPLTVSKGNSYYYQHENGNVNARVTNNTATTPSVGNDSLHGPFHRRRDCGAEGSEAFIYERAFMIPTDHNLSFDMLCVVMLFNLSLVFHLESLTTTMTSTAMSPTATTLSTPQLRTMSPTSIEASHSGAESPDKKALTCYTMLMKVLSQDDEHMELAAFRSPFFTLIALNNMGEIHHRNGQFEEARGCFDDISELLAVHDRGGFHPFLAGTELENIVLNIITLQEPTTAAGA